MTQPTSPARGATAAAPRRSSSRGTAAALCVAVALVGAATLVHPSAPALAGQCPTVPATSASTAPDVRDPLFAEQMAVLVRRWVAEGAAPAAAR